MVRKEAYMGLTNEDLQALASLLDKKLQPINDRLDRIEGRLDNLESIQAEIKRELIIIDRKNSDTYKVALDAWVLGTQNRAWLQGKEPKKAIS
jgi:hypothetical protein